MAGAPGGGRSRAINCRRGPGLPSDYHDGPPPAQDGGAGAAHPRPVPARPPPPVPLPQYWGRGNYGGRLVGLLLSCPGPGTGGRAVAGRWFPQFPLSQLLGEGDRGWGPATEQTARVEENQEIRNALRISCDALEALHRATHVPIVADFYTRLYKPETLSIKDQPLYEALNHLADAMRLRWNREDGWLQFRSASFYNDRAKEVPNRLLSRWAAARREHGFLILD